MLCNLELISSVRYNINGFQNLQYKNRSKLPNPATALQFTALLPCHYQVGFEKQQWWIGEYVTWNLMWQADILYRMEWYLSKPLLAAREIIILLTMIWQSYIASLLGCCIAYKTYLVHHIWPFLSFNFVRTQIESKSNKHICRSWISSHLSNTLSFLSSKGFARLHSAYRMDLLLIMCLPTTSMEWWASLIYLENKGRACRVWDTSWWQIRCKHQSHVEQLVHPFLNHVMMTWENWCLGNTSFLLVDHIASMSQNCRHYK